MLKTKYCTEKLELENKIPDTSGLAKKTDYNTKITEIENKIPDINNLATNILVNKVENRIPDIRTQNTADIRHQNTAHSSIIWPVWPNG